MVRDWIVLPFNIRQITFGVSGIACRSIIRKFRVRSESGMEFVNIRQMRIQGIWTLSEAQLLPF